MLVGCGETKVDETLDGKAIYESASAKMEALDSLANTTKVHAEFTAVGEMTPDSEPKVMEVMTKVSAKNLQSENDLEYQMDFYSNFLGEETKMQQWYFDGAVYTADDAHRYVFELEEDDDSIEDTMEDTGFAGLDLADAFKFEANAKDGKTYISIEPRPEEIDEMIEELDLGIDPSVVNQGDFEISNIEIIVNEEGYFEEQSFNLAFVSEGLNVKVDLSIAFSDFNDVEIESIDPNSFNNINEVIENKPVISQEVLQGLNDLGYQLYGENNFVKQVNENEVYLLNLEGMYLACNNHVYSLVEDVYFDGDTSCIYYVAENMIEGECDNDALKRGDILSEEVAKLKQVLKK